MAPVVQKMDNVIHWVSLYPTKNAIGLANTYTLDGNFEVISAIQRLNNQPFVFIVVTPCLCYFITGSPRF